MHDKETIHVLQGLPTAALTLLNSHSTFHIHISIVGYIYCIYQNTPTVRVHIHLNCNIVMTWGTLHNHQIPACDHQVIHVPESCS